MKKLVLILATLTICNLTYAQEPEKTKSSPPPSRGQERSINEIGVSVKSNPKKSAKTKSVTPAAAAPKEEKQKEEKSTEVKKPE